ncbi:phage recombination protein Bet [Ligilactobacillus agilis DSM 20509]|uniref:Phage recombination protein Bet n=1 Tax=Ligilactobacillus agilis DSM 20509 TaxID=1423718 RepID=A0A0R2A9K2_9LACO|nr:phage recombination protein Bet [Ligilactobacillus agilis]KRM63354.1 phage recombination protein Bet [Ligilactobacillus agilis DSM 20509]
MNTRYESPNYATQAQYTQQGAQVANTPAVNQEHSVTFQANGEDVKLAPSTVRNYLVSGNGKVTDQEVVMFINLCKYQHLNPFLNEAYIVKFGSQPAQLITSKEAFMKRAEANEHFRGSKAGVIVVRNNEIIYSQGAFALPSDTIVGGWAEVKRDDREEPIHIEISFDEFNKKQATWKDMPANMIRKTALVNALREAFPDSLGSLYTEDDKSETASVVPNQAERKQAQKESAASSLISKALSKSQTKKEPAKHIEAKGAVPVTEMPEKRDPRDPEEEQIDIFKDQIERQKAAKEAE